MDVILGVLLDSESRRDRLPATEDQEPMAPESSTIAPGQLQGGSADRPQAIAGPWDDDHR
jgi:hypothetical protein